jgi:NAD(P)-dependent dehydrogenase (short-subunit alcohol dehydrogenase family)
MGEVMTELRFDGRVAVITGAGRGLGRAYAELLAARGAKVLVNDNGASMTGAGTTEDPASDTVAAIVAAGGEAEADRNSVATADGGRAIVEHALDRWGRIDVLVNNAGAAALVDSPADITDAGLDITLRTHLYGCFHTIRTAWPTMVAQGYGRVCNVSSSTALGVENSWDYPAAKAGVLGLTRSLAVVGARDGITVNALMPMAFTRPMHGYRNDAVREWMRASFPVDQVAPALAFLVHESVPCNGETLTAGAGRVARVCFAVAPGYQAPGQLTIEDVAEHWSTITDESSMVVVRTSRDEIALYTGETAWQGGGYE